jgi:hypothetical protein
VKLDMGMRDTCLVLVQECKKLKEEARKKSKLLAKKLIEGYSEDKPDPVKLVEPAQEKRGWIAKSLDCVRNLCKKVLKR